MFELTPANLPDYLRRRGLVGVSPVQVSELADGVSNAVLRIDAGERRFVLKQARPQLRTREKWHSDISRIWREREVMSFLAPLLPKGAVPEILFEDRENYAFAMSHAPEPFRNWRAVLLAGDIDLELGKKAGRLLGSIHQKTHGTLEQFADRTIFEQLRVDPFYVRIKERLPDISDEMDSLIERCRVLRLGLCHGDFSPKNLLVHNGEFTLVDYETAHWGDVTFDIGFFLSHIILKSVQVSAKRGEFLSLASDFWSEYRSAATFAAAESLLIPGIQHLAGCLLARVDGTSPAPYLTDEGKKTQVRRLGRKLLRQRPESWSKLLQVISES
jgi:5-methylthioribose kinase